METRFSAQQLQDSTVRASESELRRCVHCGFCTATCPTYVLLGDELDSPRGRIYLIKDMLETQRRPSAAVVKHLDRCLSCLSCVTSCPSGVNYMHLIDHAREYIEARHRRPWPDRILRWFLAHTLPYRRRFALLMALGRPARRLLLPLSRAVGMKRSTAMLALIPPPAPRLLHQAAAATTLARGRVALLQGCAEPVLAPQIQAATKRLLGRMGFELAAVPDEGCCGALVHHLGRTRDAQQQAGHNVRLWHDRIASGEIEAVLVNASGCGSTLKNYGHMLRDDTELAAPAARVSAASLDISEFIARHGLPTPLQRPPLRVAWQAPCSLQHGQNVRDEPRDLLRSAGFEVLEPAEAHLCCGSAGTYNLLQPEISAQLRQRKLENITRLQPDIIASSNIGCITQLNIAAPVPVVHIIELLDWACGGPQPAALHDRLPAAHASG